MLRILFYKNLKLLFKKNLNKKPHKKIYRKKPHKKRTRMVLKAGHKVALKGSYTARQRRGRLLHRAIYKKKTK